MGEWNEQMRWDKDGCVCYALLEAYPGLEKNWTKNTSRFDLSGTIGPLYLWTSKTAEIFASSWNFLNGNGQREKKDEKVCLICVNSDEQ